MRYAALVGLELRHFSNTLSPIGGLPLDSLIQWTAFIDLLS